MRCRRARWRRESPMPRFAFSSRAPLHFGDDFGGVKRRGKPLLFVVISRAIPESGSPNAGRAMPADDISVGVLAEQIVKEKVLGDDRVTLHSHHLGDMRDVPRAV